jgi:Mg2+ and Co2+ transporter CorA
MTADGSRSSLILERENGCRGGCDFVISTLRPDHNKVSNRILFVLTLVTVLALPFDVAAGLFGMNVGGIPLRDDAHGFLIVIAAVTGFTGVILLFALRRRRR